MCDCTRRSAMGLCVAALAGISSRASAAPSDHEAFVAAAFQMKDDAVRAGDQPYGAVIVMNGRIAGHGPSRVVTNKDWTAHAEREAIRDAQKQLSRHDLSGGVMYSTSRPCENCERAAADASIARMFHGAGATDAGAPRARSLGPTR